MTKEQMLQRCMVGDERFKNIVDRAEYNPPMRLFADELVRIAYAYDLDVRDLIQVHSMDLDRHLRENQRTMKALRRLQEEGEPIPYSGRRAPPRQRDDEI